SSSFTTARSMPGLTASTKAARLSPDCDVSTNNWLAYWTTWALVRIRRPSITTPVPLASRGLCLAQGRSRSGKRRVADTFTTDSRIAASRSPSPAPGAAPTPARTKHASSSEIHHPFFMRTLDLLDDTGRANRGTRDDRRTVSSAVHHLNAPP